MDTTLLKRQFLRMGARVKFAGRPGRRAARAGRFSIDVRKDKRGEFFEIFLAEGVGEEVEVLDVQPRLRHLLLMRREEGQRGPVKHKFLCGHDERFWFVAAVPGGSNVRTALEELKPRAVRREQARKKLTTRKRNRRRNAAFLRQGEWFFVPCPSLLVDERVVLTDEPLSRGGKPHRAEYLYRTGGETVYVSRLHPNGLTESQYQAFVVRNRGARPLNWTVMRRDPGVYVKGRVSHPDHKTIVLHCWHEVLPNTESAAPSRRHVAFLD